MVEEKQCDGCCYRRTCDKDLTKCCYLVQGGCIIGMQPRPSFINVQK